MTPTAMPAFAPLESPDPEDGADAGAADAAPLAYLVEDAGIGVQYCSQLDANSEIGFDAMVLSVGSMGWRFGATAPGPGACARKKVLCSQFIPRNAACRKALPRM